MTQVGATRLEQLGRFLLRGLCNGASTVSVVELLRNDWTGGRASVPEWPGWCVCRWSDGCQPCRKGLRTDQQLGVPPG